MGRNPRVSICVPNFNTRRYLGERFDTIFAQSFRDWELLVYDSYSTDGAWEYIRDLSFVEPNLRAWQGPREGTPGSWTPCLRQARGDYVYIATSDDTMPPDFLRIMVAALDAHPTCDIAHCRLRAIDEEGRESADWWLRDSVFSRSSGPLVRQMHVRRAPFDGLLHLGGTSVFISLTQLLIRRSLFDRIGFFQSTWGSVGDFNWSMRAGLAANTVHVPDTWGGWRVHAAQATAGASLGSAEHTEKIDGMIDDALAACAHLLPPVLRRQLQGEWAPEAQRLRAFYRGLAGRPNPARRRKYIAVQLLAGAAPAWAHTKAKLLAQPSADTICRRARQWLDSTNFGPALVPSSAAAAAHPPSFPRTTPDRIEASL